MPADRCGSTDGVKPSLPDAFVDLRPGAAAISFRAGRGAPAIIQSRHWYYRFAANDLPAMPQTGAYGLGPPPAPAATVLAAIAALAGDLAMLLATAVDNSNGHRTINAAHSRPGCMTLSAAGVSPGSQAQHAGHDILLSGASRRPTSRTFVYYGDCRKPVVMNTCRR